MMMLNFLTSGLRDDVELLDNGLMDREVVVWMEEIRCFGPLWAKKNVQ